MVTLLKDLKVGEFSKPTPFDQSGKKGVCIAYLKSRTEPHRENLKDDYDRVAQRALRIKKQEVIEKMVRSKNSFFYLLIDKEFNECQTLSTWLRFAAKADN